MYILLIIFQCKSDYFYKKKIVNESQKNQNKLLKYPFSLHFGKLRPQVKFKNNKKIA